MLTRTLVVLATLTALTGCSALREPGSPKQSFSIQEDIMKLQEVSAFHVTIEDYYCIGMPQPCGVTPAATAIAGTPPSLEAPAVVPAPPPSGAIPNNANLKEQQKSFRNKFIAFRLVTINLHYVEFVKEVAVNKAQLDTALDVLNLGLTLSSTVVGGQATAAILSAAAAGVAGTRISYDKNFYFEKTVPVLVTAMNAQRKTALVQILIGIRQDIDRYPFEQAITDLHIYFEAGTFNGALQSIQKDAGAKEVKADEAITIVVRSGAEFIRLGPKFDELVAAVDKIPTKEDVHNLILNSMFTVDPTTKQMIDAQAIPATADAPAMTAEANIRTFTIEEAKQFLKVLVLNIDRTAATLSVLQSAFRPFASG